MTLQLLVDDVTLLCSVRHCLPESVEQATASDHVPESVEQAELTWFANQFCCWPLLGATDHGHLLHDDGLVDAVGRDDGLVDAGILGGVAPDFQVSVSWLVLTKNRRAHAGAIAHRHDGDDGLVDAGVLGGVAPNFQVTVSWLVLTKNRRAHAPAIAHRHGGEAQLCLVSALANPTHYQVHNLDELYVRISVHACAF